MKLIKSDWIVIGAFALLIVTHASTNYLISYYSTAAAQLGVAEDVVQVMEQNLFARWFYMFNDLKALFQFLIMPTFFFGVYYYWRQKFKETNPELLETIALMVFMANLLNASNDFSIVLGVMAR